MHSLTPTLGLMPLGQRPFRGHLQLLEKLGVPIESKAAQHILQRKRVLGPYLTTLVSSDAIQAFAQWAAATEEALNECVDALRKDSTAKQFIIGHGRMLVDLRRLLYVLRRESGDFWLSAIQPSWRSMQVPDVVRRYLLFDTAVHLGEQLKKRSTVASVVAAVTFEDNTAARKTAHAWRDHVKQYRQAMKRLNFAKLKMSEFETTELRTYSGTPPVSLDQFNRDWDHWDANLPKRRRSRTTPSRRK